MNSSSSFLRNWTFDKVSFSVSFSSTAGDTGYLETESSMLRSFPGMCIVVNENLNILSLNFRILGFLISSRFLIPMTGTSGLWSVLTNRFLLPRVNIDVISSALERARASPSMGE